MQTFLPHPNYFFSARALDSRRLNKQSVECYQIGLILWRKRGWIPVEYKSNGLPKKGFWNHPAVRMWEGHEHSFLDYWQAIINECADRHISISLLTLHHRKLSSLIPPSVSTQIPFFSEDFHKSHQSNLKRKDSSYYDFPVPSNLPYIWPK
jgi:hypothetical protein